MVRLRPLPASCWMAVPSGPAAPTCRTGQPRGSGDPEAPTRSGCATAQADPQERSPGAAQRRLGHRRPRTPAGKGNPSRVTPVQGDQPGIGGHLAAGHEGRAPGVAGPYTRSMSSRRGLHQTERWPRQLATSWAEASSPTREARKRRAGPGREGSAPGPRPGARAGAATRSPSAADQECVRGGGGGGCMRTSQNWTPRGEKPLVDLGCVAEQVQHKVARQVLHRKAPQHCCRPRSTLRGAGQWK